MSKPIFILGSGRSGTSILTGALRSGAGIEGYLEGHFLPLVLLLMKDIERYYYSKRQLIGDDRHMITHVTEEDVESKILSIFKHTCESLATHEVWLDKSPDSAMIKAVPYLLEIWPESKFIFAKRRGIENVISRLKKFPKVSFERHCQMWKDCMESWIITKKNLDSSLYIEVEQRQIALHPQQVAQEIGKFISLDSNQITRVAKIFTNQRPQSTGSVETEEAFNISEVGWSEDQVNFFRENCSSISQKFGYSETASYYIL